MEFKISGKAPNKYDILIQYVEWVAAQHYMNGLSKTMIIEKANDVLKMVNEYEKIDKII